MRNRKLLYVLIPVIIVVLILIAGVVYLKLNSTPEKIFEHSISKVFGMFETTEEQYTTMKGTMNFSVDFENENIGSTNTEAENTQTENANMESTGTYSDLIGKVNEANQSQNVDTDDIENMVTDVYTELYNALEASNIELSMEVDTENMIVNDSINVLYDNENLINATVLLQDEKGYIYLPEYLDKYLELSEDDLDYTELTESYKKAATLDQNALIEAIKDELVSSISSQELVQEDTTLVLDGQETKVTASTLSLKGEAQTTFTRELLTKLKENEKFQTALGAYKEDVLLKIDEKIQYLNDKESLANDMGDEELQDEIQDIVNNREFRISIYTKGFLNEFVGISVQQIDERYMRTDGIDLLKHNEGKYELVSYTTSELARENNLDVVIENKKESKNKGTATIAMTVDGETFTIVYNYEKHGNGTTFVLSTEIEEEKFAISGNVVQDGKNIKGNITVTQDKTFGKININCAYDFTYDVEVQKVDTQNAVLIDELSEEDQTTLMTNLQNSKLYEVVEEITGFNVANNEPEVTYAGYTVTYNIPDGFKASSYNSEEYKMYMDDNFNSVNVSINEASVDTYMKDLEDEYALTSEFYENQKISDTRSLDINGKEYKFRTLAYNDEFGTYVNLYFIYQLDNEYCYVVEVETEGGNISMDTIKNFLDVNVLRDMNSLMNKVVEDTSEAIEQEEDLANGKIIVHGKEYNSIDEYINSTL